MELIQENQVRMLMNAMRRQDRLYALLVTLVVIEALALGACNLLAYGVIPGHDRLLDAGRAFLSAHLGPPVKEAAKPESSKAQPALPEQDGESSISSAKHSVLENADFLVEGYTIPTDEAFNDNRKPVRIHGWHLTPRAR